MAAVTLLGSDVSTSSGTRSVTATPAVGDLIVLFIGHTGNPNVTSINPTDNNAGGGGTYTLITSCLKATSADSMGVFVRNALVTSATSTTFTQFIGTTTGGFMGVMKITGMTRTGLTSAAKQSAVQSNQAAAGTPTPVFGAAALTDNPVLGAVFNATNPAGMAPRGTPAYTERLDSGYATPTTGVEIMTIDSGETGTSIAWGGTSASAFCGAVVELDTTPAPVPLTTVAATGAVGSFGKTIDKALTTVAATGAVGSLAPVISPALTTVAATGAVGSFGKTIDKALTTVAATGVAGDAAPTFPVDITGVSAEGAAGDVAPSAAWAYIDDSQTPGWAPADDSQTPGWTPVDDSQTPGWEDVL